MARKIWLVFRTVVFVSCVLVLWNVFSVLRLHQAQQVPSIVESALPLSPSSPDKSKFGPTFSFIDQDKVVHKLENKSPQQIKIAAVVCGNRINETLVMMKSALFTSSSVINFILFSDELATSTINETVRLWPDKILKRVHLDLRPITFPAERADEWKKLFKPCASQRLFLPSLLGEVDSVLYMDTDTIFLNSPERIWEHFAKMDQFQMAAVAPEHEDYSTGWYNRFARHPYYGNLGVNSGVMLMNLTRMREFGWEKYVVPVYQEYKTKITWGDQDIINIVFHFHPEKLYVYPCHYNYRPDHCMYMSVCKTAEEEGIFVLHGNRGSFHTEKQPAFKAMYTSIEQFSLGSDSESQLLTTITERLAKTVDSNCGKLMNIFTKALEDSFNHPYLHNDKKL